MNVENAEQAAVIAGLVTAPTGVVLLAAPHLVGMTGLSSVASRAIGAADLALAPGLLAGRPRWPWAAARAAANVPTAVILARTGTPAALTIAATLLVLTCLDAAAARTLRAARR